MVEFLIYVLLGLGLAFNVLAVLGLFRFPDVYTRLHAETKTTTFGSIFIILAVITYAYQIMDFNPFFIIAVHSLVALVILFVVNPTGAHAIARASYDYGIEPIAIVDHLKEEGGRKK